MPSVSRKQHNFMQAIAHSPEFAKEAGVSQGVGQDFTNADKRAHKYARGGLAHNGVSDLLQELHDETHFGPGGLVEKLTPQLQKFYDLLTHVPIQPVTGAKAAAVLKGQDMQKAADLARQLQGATQQGVRGPALKAIQEKALRDMTGGDPNAVISRGGLGQALQQPLSLTRVKTRQDLLPEKYQEKYGMAKREHNNNDDAEFTPDEAWVGDRDHEILNDWFYNSGDTYDHNDVMHDVFYNADNYLTKGHEYDPSSRQHSRASEFLGQFMSNEGVPQTHSNKFAMERGAVTDNRDPDYPAKLRDINAREGMHHADMVRAMLSDNPKEAMRKAQDLGYDTKDGDFRRLVREMPQYGSLKSYAKDNPDHLDGTHDYTDTYWFERERENHEESNRGYFEEQNYHDAYREAEQAAREGGHGEYTGGGDGEGDLKSAGPYKYGTTQRLTSQRDPDLYTQQNVFGFSPTGLTRTNQGRGNPGYRMDLDPQTLQKAYEKLMAKGDSSYYAQLLKQSIDNPNAASMASHFPEFTPFNKRQSYLGHFRGSSEGDNTPFLLEELQSDPAQTFSKMGLGKAAPPSLQDWVGQMGSAALHHAAETGASSFHVPTAAAIDRLRVGTDYGWLYDKSIPQDVLNPIAQHYGLNVNEGTFPGGGPRGDIPTRSIDLPDEVRQDILSKGVPYAEGGGVDADMPDFSPIPPPHDDINSLRDLGRFAASAARMVPAGAGSIPHGLAGLVGMIPYDPIRNAAHAVQSHLPSSEDIASSRFYPPPLPASSRPGDAAIDELGGQTGDFIGGWASPGHMLKGAMGAGKTVMKLIPKGGKATKVLEDTYAIPPTLEAHALGGPIRMNIRRAATAPTVNDPIIAHLMRHTPKIGKSPAPSPMRFADGGSVDPDDLLAKLSAYLSE